MKFPFLGRRLRPLLALLLGLGGSVASLAAQPISPGGQSPPAFEPDTSLDLSAPTNIWDGAVGDGFRSGAREAGFALGWGLGMRVISSSEQHYLALTRIHYGWILDNVLGRGHWWQGNFEFRLEGFGGAQYNPHTAYLTGFTPLFRYNVATRSRWMPFLTAGAGLSLTDIGNPDLSTTFEFNLQAGTGVHYFWRRNSAITFEYRFLHLSNASIASPNLGVNSSVFSLGMSWFF